MAAGRSKHAIAQRLVVAVSTVKNQLANLYANLDAHRRSQALLRAR